MLTLAGSRGSGFGAKGVMWGLRVQGLEVGRKQGFGMWGPRLKSLGPRAKATKATLTMGESMSCEVVLRSVALRATHI